jgi:hypothetical protein
VKVRTLLAILLLAAAVRGPLWAFAARASVDGDTAIVGLMARHPTRGTTLWGQPYGSPLDGWTAAPFVAALGSTPIAVRLPYALLSLALVAVGCWLGERACPGAGPLAGVLLACPPPYLLLLAAFPPPLYSTTLVLLAIVVALSVGVAETLGAGARPAPARLVAIGLLGGLAAWTHLMSLATLTAVAVVLFRAARRVPARAWLLWALMPFLAASAPWWVRVVREPSAASVLGIANDGAPPFAHARSVALRLAEPVSALAGVWTPLTADEGERVVRAPAAVGVLLALAWAFAAVAGVLALRSRAVGALLAGAVVLTVLAFPFPVRSDPHTVRFLTPALVPLAVLAAAGAVQRAGRRRAWLLVVALCAANLWTGARLREAWRQVGPDGIVPDCAPVVELLARSGIVRAYASYHTAYCVTYTSGETVVASPPWNERFYGYPMPYLDEVRFATRVAWVLVPGVDFGLPSPRTFESKLVGIGGRYARHEAGPAVVFDDFVPPFGARAAPRAVAGPSGDGDVSTRILEPAAGPAVFMLREPVATAGLTLLAGPSDPGLPRAMDVEVSSDGSTFQRVARRRRGRETIDLAWIDGHPQFLVDDLAFSTALDGRFVTAVRITPTEAAPWSIAEILVHPVVGEAGPWTSGDRDQGSWRARRDALMDHADPFDAGWNYRTLLARRNP